MRPNNKGIIYIFTAFHKQTGHYSIAEPIVIEVSFFRKHNYLTTVYSSVETTDTSNAREVKHIQTVS